MLVQAYLEFKGRCEEAVEFYKKALGAEVEMLMRFKDMPADACGSGDAESDAAGGGGSGGGDRAEKVMHTSFLVGETRIMASDGMADGEPTFEGISLAISVDDDAAAERVFEALGDGGAVLMPLGKTFWTSKFGMIKDRFGVSWMISVATEESGP